MHIAGDESSCLRTLGRLRELDLPDVPAWRDEYRVCYCFTAHHQTVQRASCLLELGQVREAIASNEGHRTSWQQLCRWEHAVHTARLAHAYALLGEVDHAAAVGSQALEFGVGTGSALVVAELRKLDVWRSVPAIAHLAGSLTGSLPRGELESAESDAETR